MSCSRRASAARAAGRRAPAGAPVELLDALEERPLGGRRAVKWRVPEAPAPVAEVARDDEHRPGVAEVRRQEAPVALLALEAQRADEDGHQPDAGHAAEHVRDVRRVHLHAMLRLVVGHVHLVELPGRAELRVRLGAHLEVADGRPVELRLRERAAGEVVVVRGPEQEHPLHVAPQRLLPQVRVRVRRARPGVRVPRVRRNHAADAADALLRAQRRHGREPAAQLPLELRAVVRVPGAGVRRPAAQHARHRPASGRWSQPPPAPRPFAR